MPQQLKSFIPAQLGWMIIELQLTACAFRLILQALVVLRSKEPTLVQDNEIFGTAVPLVKAKIPGAVRARAKAP